MNKPQVWILASCMLALLTSCASQQSWQTRLTADDPAERIRAVREIANAGDTKQAPQLVARLEDEDSAVRFYAIMGLERLTGKRRGYTYYGTRHDRAAAVLSWQQYLIEIGATPISTNSETSAHNDTATQNRTVTHLQEEDKKENG